MANRKKEVTLVSPENVAVEDSEQEAGEDDVLAKNKAVGEAEAFKVEGEAKKPLKTRVQERKKVITTIQRSLVKMFNQMTSTKNEDGMMLFSPESGNVSSRAINQRIEEEVEKRLKAQITPTELKGVEKRVFQDDDEEDRQRLQRDAQAHHAVRLRARHILAARHDDDATRQHCQRAYCRGDHEEDESRLHVQRSNSLWQAEQGGASARPCRRRSSLKT